MCSVQVHCVVYMHIYHSHEALVRRCQLFVGSNGQVVDADKGDPMFHHPISATFCQSSVVCLEGGVVHQLPAGSAITNGPLEADALQHMFPTEISW